MTYNFHSPMDIAKNYKHVYAFTKKQVKFCSFAMAQLTIEQRVLIVKYYIQTQSIAAVRDAFRARFPNRNVPSKSTIWRNVQKYLSSGTSHNRNKGNSGRRRVARSEENVAAVRNLLEENPENVSARRNGLGISRSSFNRITKLELRWHTLSNAHKTLVATNRLSTASAFFSMVD